MEKVIYGLLLDGVVICEGSYDFCNTEMIDRIISKKNELNVSVESEIEEREENIKDWFLVQFSDKNLIYWIEYMICKRN